MKKIFKYGLVFIKDNKILLCKKRNLNELILPGGKKEGNETFAESILREINEELGSNAIIERDSLQYIGNYSDLAAGKTDTIVEIELYQGIISGEIKPSQEIEDLIWFSINDDTNTLSKIIKDKIWPDLLRNGYIT